MSRPEPPDSDVRERIRTELDTSFLVEAGAGSGKTTMMVARMVELVRTGRARAGEIAAVTFTRKSAGELRERFQEGLEEALRQVPADSESYLLLEAALVELAGSFIGTIHAFCGRILREHALDAGLPPNFKEIAGVEAERFEREAWTAFLEHLHSRRSPSRLLARLDRLGLAPRQLKGVVREVAENSDVRLPIPRSDPPDPRKIEAVRAQFEDLLDRSLALMPTRPAIEGPDSLQSKVEELSYMRRADDWDDAGQFLSALSTAARRSNKIVQKRWTDDPETREHIKALAESWDEFEGDDGVGGELLGEWQEYRYPTVIRFALAAERFHRSERARHGVVSLHDLLRKTARLLERRADIRGVLGKRFPYLLVDEFQDTDPIQTRILFLLASDSEAGIEDDATGSSADWSQLAPRPGSLFVVGDPKQSIYRFRRADMALYQAVRRRFTEFGDVLHLSANFRAMPLFEPFVNRTFSGLFPVAGTGIQAPFGLLKTVRTDREPGRIGWYRVEPGEERGAAGVVEPDREFVSNWIEREIRTGRRTAGDFMILTRRKAPLGAYAAALERRGVPVQVTGASFAATEELRELILLLEALGDPVNSVLLLAVLEGPFFGIAPDALLRYRARGGDFELESEPAENGAAEVAEAIRVLRRHRGLLATNPVEVAIAAIVQDLGLIPLLAGRGSGSLAAGSFFHMLEVLRDHGRRTTLSLTGAVEVLRHLIEEEVEAPLHPGDANVVRLMNLHQAKGLEASVVILAFPLSGRGVEPRAHYRRGSRGAEGYLEVLDDSYRGRDRLAAPQGWISHVRAEKEHEEAEEDRLLYVAVTRARDELIVGRCSRTEGTSPWSKLHPMLDDEGLAVELVLPSEKNGIAEPTPLDSTPEELGLSPALEDMIHAARPSYGWFSASSLDSVQDDTGFDGVFEFPDLRERVGHGSLGGGGGKELGRFVHKGLEILGSAGDPGLEEWIEEMSESIATKEDKDIYIEQIVAHVDAVKTTDVWHRASTSPTALRELPFALPLDGKDESWAEVREILGSSGRAEFEEDRVVVRGVIDLVFREGEGWVLVDFKSDPIGDPSAMEDRAAAYRRQVDLYAACWEALSGEPVSERVLLFTERGLEVRW